MHYARVWIARSVYPGRCEGVEIMSSPLETGRFVENCDARWCTLIVITTPPATMSYRDSVLEGQINK